MFTPEPPLKFPPADQAIADRLMKIVPEIDRLEGYAQPHAMAVARLAESLAHQLDLRGHDLTALLLAALAHDLGERTMKRNYLLREDALSWEETLDLWRHPILGEQQSAELNLPRQAQLLIRWHHEAWNGEGYPDALAGEAIPLGARILRVADTWCALTSDRPYRAALDPVDAEEMIAEQAGVELDPLVVQTLLDLFATERAREEELLVAHDLEVDTEGEESVYEMISDLPTESPTLGEVTPEPEPVVPEPVIPITEDPTDEPAVEAPDSPGEVATEETKTPGETQPR